MCLLRLRMIPEAPVFVVFLALSLSESDLKRSAAQRVAPGVPPTQYEHYEHQQDFQQPPAAQHQQPGQQAGHGEYGDHVHVHHEGQQLLDASNLDSERQHIQEHMDVPVNTSQMSEEELMFHYFQMIDSDKDNKLDGCDLVKSVIHWQNAEEDPQGGQPIPKIMSDEKLMETVDSILKKEDKNGDGYIDYAEFKLAQAQATQT